MANFEVVSLELFVEHKPWNCEEWVHEEDDEVLADKQDWSRKKCSTFYDTINAVVVLLSCDVIYSSNEHE